MKFKAPFLKRLTGSGVPLLPQMLWPIILAELLLLGGIVTWYASNSLQRIHAQAKSRAEIVSQTFEHRSQNNINFGNLSRMAESLAANRDIREITLIDTTTNNVRASSNPMLVGTSPLTHPNEDIHILYATAQLNKKQQGVFRGNAYYLLTPTVIPTPERFLAGNAVATANGLMVTTLDLSNNWAAFQRDLTVFALAGALLICVTILLIYGLLYHYVSTPLGYIRQTMQRYTQGERNVATPILDSSEFNDVASSLNTMLHQLTENERQLNAYTTQMRKLTAEMQTARDEALHASTMKNEFMATMSHEIRTPMNGVIGMTDLLLESGLTGKQAHYARTVQQSAEALLSLIDDILDFSKIEAGKIEMESISFPLADLCESIGDILAVKARDKGLEVAIHLDPRLPACLVGDPARLRQVLVNLLGNAIKFTQTGYVMLSAGLAHPPPGGRWNEGTTCLLTLEVKDTGIGIPADVQHKVFEKFVQADSSTTRKYGGTGLGLAICRQLVSLMGGSISLHSEVGRGTTFTINLALPVGSQKEPPKKWPHLAGKRVLVVDDLPINITVITNQLAQLGVYAKGVFDATQAQAEAAAAVARGEPYHAFLIDFIMPVHTGDDLGTQLHAIEAYQNTPIIMMTASDNQAQQRLFAEKGFALLLSKPFGLTTVAEALSEVLSNSSQNPKESAPSITAATYHGKRALVADDNRSNRDYISALLEGMGFTVTEAADGHEAQHKVHEATQQGAPFDIALLDCEMPGCDGREAALQLRETWTPAALPILALTGHTSTAEVESCKAAGMNACLAKPLRRPELEAALHTWLPQGAPRQHNLTGHTIMLVEDNRFNREYLTEVLRGCGATVHVAENGTESLKVLASHPYIESILMDCQMPEMDGYEATIRIRERQASGEWPYIPIIALTANAMKGDREKCLAVGMDDYLSKPVSSQQLLGTLQSWLTTPAQVVTTPSP